MPDAEQSGASGSFTADRLLLVAVFSGKGETEVDFSLPSAWIGVLAKPLWFQFYSVKPHSQQNPESRTQTVTRFDFTSEVSALKSGETMWKVFEVLAW